MWTDGTSIIFVVLIRKKRNETQMNETNETQMIFRGLYLFLNQC